MYSSVISALSSLQAVCSRLSMSSSWDRVTGLPVHEPVSKGSVGSVVAFEGSKTAFEVDGRVAVDEAAVAVAAAGGDVNVDLQSGPNNAVAEGLYPRLTMSSPCLRTKC